MTLEEPEEKTPEEEFLKGAGLALAVWGALFLIGGICLAIWTSLFGMGFIDRYILHIYK